MHEGTNGTLVMVYVEKHGKKDIAQNTGTAFLNLGLKTLFHEAARAFGEIKENQMDSLCSEPGKTVYLAFAISKCQDHTVRMIGVNKLENNLEHHRFRQSGNYLGMHLNIARRSREYAANIQANLKDEQIVGASFGSNHVSLTLDELKKRGFSYILVVPEAYDKMRGKN